MIVTLKDADITTTEAPVILYCGPHDWPTQQAQTFDKMYPALEQERLSMYNKPNWEPGKAVAFSDISVGPHRILMGCISAINEAPQYNHIRNLLSKIASIYEQVEMYHLATPLIGIGGLEKGLIPDVIETFFGVQFSEPEGSYVADKSLRIDLHSYT